MEKGNGERNHEEDEEGHINDGNSTDSTSGNGKPRDVNQESNNPRDKGKMIKCFICQGPHMVRKCPKKSIISAIKKKDEPKEEAKPIEGKTSMVNSMVLIPKKRNDEEGLMFVDINIVGQKRSAVIDTGASDLFISEKAAKKLGLSIKKSNKKIKIVNFEKAPTMRVDSDNSVSMGRSNSYCHWSIIKDCCASESRYEGWDQCVVVNPTSQRCFTWEKH
ncbi:hypothetical protein Gotri_000969 [Gossypium trilobum]|uniref:Uncharacterized protein n=1 Tax=Gossypium trilobum TaxID=34281 RepID=A0A7J9FE12_9ROSI|nr:hypothetical protein [Gossypium trilobum]